MKNDRSSIIEKMVEKPYLILMGAGKLSKMFGVTREDIRACRDQARIVLKRDAEETIVMPNILVIDIETAPIKAFVWRIWKENISLDQISSDWFMLSWSAKWLFSGDVISDCLNPDEAVAENDSRIVNSAWKILNSADIVIAHNGISFDIPKMNARFIRWGLPPTKPYKQIDTRIIASKQFGFTSNKLEALARMFNIPGKLDTDFKLWVNCINGDPEALRIMEEYNRHDVEVLEAVYLKLRPWIKGHVNLGLYSDGDSPVCPNCGSVHVHLDGGSYYTGASRFPTYRCSDCGAIARSRYSDMTKGERKNNIISIAQ